MTILDEYVKTVSEVCDAPEMFIKASAYSLISNLLGRYFTAFEMPYGRPNLWFLISSIPGRFRRSTVASYFNHAYTQTLLKYLELKQKPKQENEEEEIEPKKLIDMSLIEEGTPEGIADAITFSYEKGIDTFSIFSSEWGGVLKRMAEQQYMSGTLNLLSKLYYGEGGSIHLSQRSGGKMRYIPEGLYVTMFTGMQEPELYLTPSMVRQGTMRRILIIFEKQANRWMQPIKIGYDQAYDEITAWSHKVADLMIKYETMRASHMESYFKRFAYLHIFMHPKTVDILNVKASQLDAELDKSPTNENIYKQSLWEHLAKLAMNECIAEGIFTPETKEEMPRMIISPIQLEKAKSFLDNIENKMEGIINALGEQPAVMKSYRTPLETVYGIIAKNNGLTTTQIYHKCPNWIRNSVKELLETLLAQGRIKRDGPFGTIGAPSWKYYIVDH